MTNVTAVIFDAGRAYPHELDARQACLLAVITGQVGCRDTLGYSHARASEEPLLAIPDAVAWCWAKGGHWRVRIARPVVTGVARV